MKIDQVGPHLFRFLRLMDAEAVTMSAPDVPTGLGGYGKHARQDITRPQNELEWSRRLAALFRLDGIECETERPYSQVVAGFKRQRLDLWVKLDGSQSIAIEIKGAWSDYWGRQSRIYRCYLLFPLIAGTDASKTHTVPHDLQKLQLVHSPEADHVGMLLIGFESADDSMVPDVKELIDAAGLHTWAEQTDTWESPTDPARIVRCWFWHRPAC